MMFFVCLSIKLKKKSVNSRSVSFSTEIMTLPVAKQRKHFFSSVSYCCVQCNYVHINILSMFGVVSFLFSLFNSEMKQSVTIFVVLQSETGFLWEVSITIWYCCPSVYGEVLRHVRVWKLYICKIIIDFYMEILFSFNFCMLPRFEVVSTLKIFQVTLNLAIALILILNFWILYN